MAKNSDAVNAAMKAAFEELLALSPEELKETLKDRPVGPVGQLYRTLGTLKQGEI